MVKSTSTGGKLLPEDVRRHNRTLVLQTLLDAGPRSRAELARETGITRVTMSDLVGDLLAEGLVLELGLRTGPGPGKPSMTVGIDHRSSYIVGIDVSDHLVFRGALMALDGEIVARAARDAGGAAGAEALAQVVELAAELVAGSERPVLGVGVASPGIVDGRGRVLSAPNLGWVDIDLAASLRAVTGVPCHVANDADLAALAERSSGAAADIVLVRIGRGVGAGILLEGRVRHGSASSAGEIGHVVAGTDGGPLCVCGKHGCLETWLAAPRLAEALASAPDAAAERAVLVAAGQRLGIVLAPVIGALDPDEVVLNGPPELLADALLDAASSTLHARTMADFHGHVRLRRSTLGVDATLLGAAARVLETELGLT